MVRWIMRKGHFTDEEFFYRRVGDDNRTRRIVHIDFRRQDLAKVYSETAFPKRFDRAMRGAMLFRSFSTPDLRPPPARLPFSPAMRRGCHADLTALTSAPRGAIPPGMQVFSVRGAAFDLAGTRAAVDGVKASSGSPRATPRAESSSRCRRRFPFHP
ncbi:hypothetical protein [Rhodosalinus sp. 5P4]|uniref:hypothetical protein n=1 Tax=Rhodosalinus sp. 5P4 TaxID=3239196 RepID=UPI003523F537